MDPVSSCLSAVRAVWDAVQTTEGNNQFAKLLCQRLQILSEPLKRGLPAGNRCQMAVEQLAQVAKNVQKYIATYHDKSRVKKFFFSSGYKEEFYELDRQLNAAHADLTAVLNIESAWDMKAHEEENAVAANAMQNRLLQTMQETKSMVMEFLEIGAEEKRAFLLMFDEYQAQHQSVLESLLSEFAEVRKELQRTEISPKEAQSEVARVLNSIDIPHFKIDPSRLGAYNTWKELGRGSFGAVYRTTLDGIPVAIKVLLCSLGDESSQEREDFHREIKVMRRLGNHPTIVSLIGHTEVRYNGVQSDALVMELCGNGSLAQRVFARGREKRMPTQERTAALVRVAAGMRYLSTEGVVHRDLKSENVMIASDGLVKISDFGLSTTRSSVARATRSKFQAAGTMGWMAPEILRAAHDPHIEISKVYGEATDVYSFGMLCYEVMARERPFHGQSEAHVRECILAGNHPNVDPENDGSPPPMRHIIHLCCNRDIALRPLFIQLHRMLEVVHSGKDPFLVHPTPGLLGAGTVTGHASPPFVSTSGGKRAERQGNVASLSSIFEATSVSQRPNTKSPRSTQGVTASPRDSDPRKVAAASFWEQSLHLGDLTPRFKSFFSRLQGAIELDAEITEDGKRALERRLDTDSAGVVNKESWTAFVVSHCDSNDAANPVWTALTNVVFAEAITAWRNGMLLGSDIVPVGTFQTAFLEYANDHPSHVSRQDGIDGVLQHFSAWEHVPRSDWVKFVAEKGKGSIASALQAMESEVQAHREAERCWQEDEERLHRQREERRTRQEEEERQRQHLRAGRLHTLRQKFQKFGREHEAQGEEEVESRAPRWKYSSSANSPPRLARESTAGWKARAASAAARVAKWHSSTTVPEDLLQAIQAVDRAWFSAEFVGGCATLDRAAAERQWQNICDFPQESYLFYADSPARLGHGVNMSAPSMHIAGIAAVKQHLKKPSLRILDVGCGTGIVTAVFALAAQPEDGDVLCVGIDHVQEFIDLAKATVSWACPELASRTAFECADARESTSSGGYDIIHSGVAIHADHVSHFLDMLKPGGVMVAPVERNDEQQFVTITRNGSEYEVETLVGVRYTKLCSLSDQE